MLYGLFCVLVVTFFLSSCSTKEKEMPITTSSEEAKQLFIQGREDLFNAEIEKAAKLFEDAIKKDSTFALAYLLRAFSGGGSEVLKSNLEKAVSLSDKVTEGEQILIKANKASNLDNDQKLGREYLRQLVTMFPEDKLAHFSYAVSFFNQGENDSAIVHLKKAIEIDAEYAPLHNILGYAYMNQNKNDEAEKEFKEYIHLAPERPNPYDSYGEFLLKVGRYDESITNYAKSNEIDPSFTNAFLAIGDNYTFKGDYVKAREYYQKYFDQAKTIDGKMDSKFREALSFIYEDKIKDAIAIIKVGADSAKKQNLTSYLTDAYSSLQYIFCELGNPKEGVTYGKKAIETVEKSNLSEKDKESKLYNLTAYLAFSHVYNNDTKKAMVELEKYKAMAMKKQDDKMYDYYHGLGLVNFKEKKYQQAIENFKKGIPDEPNNLYYLAQAYLMSGNKEEANKIFNQLKNWNQNDLSYAIVRNKMSRDKNN
jgi:Tfp pilus assembly protein PilF